MVSEAETLAELDGSEATARVIAVHGALHSDRDPQVYRLIVREQKLYASCRTRLAKTNRRHHGGRRQEHK
jgi:hypothetical protein